MSAGDFEALRERLALSPEKFADSLKIGATSVWRYSNGQSPIPLDVALRAKKLESEMEARGRELPEDPGWLGEVDDEEKSPESTPPPLHPTLEAAVQALARIVTLLERMAPPEEAQPSNPPGSADVATPGASPGPDAPVERTRGALAVLVTTPAPLEAHRRARFPADLQRSGRRRVLLLPATSSAPSLAAVARSGQSSRPLSRYGTLILMTAGLALLNVGTAFFVRHEVQRITRAQSEAMACAPVAKPSQPPQADAPVTTEPGDTMQEEEDQPDGGVTEEALKVVNKRQSSPPRESPVAKPPPSRPFKNQEKPPCDSWPEVEANGGCYIETSQKPPCGKGYFEHKGKCLVPIIETPEPPRQSETNTPSPAPPGK